MAQRAAFTPRHFHDLVRLLEEHPDWRAELRRLVLSEELLALPAAVQELAHTVQALVESQRRMEERFEALAEGQARLTEGQARLTEGYARLTEGYARLEAAVAALAESQRRTEERVAALAESQRLMQDQLGAVRGESLERRYRDHAGSKFGRLVRRAYALSDRQLGELLSSAEDQGLLSPEEVDDLREADVVVRGRRRDGADEVYLVIEVSVGIGRSDVTRAARRAMLLSKVHPALPVVAGEWVSPEARELAATADVQVVLDGRALPPSG